MHWKNLIMFSSRRIALNIDAMYGCGLYALVNGLDVDYGAGTERSARFLTQSRRDAEYAEGINHEIH